MNNTCEYRLVFQFWVNDENGRYEEENKRRTATYTFAECDRGYIEKLEEHIFDYLADRIRRMYDDDKRNESN